MNTATHLTEFTKASTVVADSIAVPWRDLTVRIQAALTRRSTFVASLEDLRVLWQGESVDFAERRRRIIVFAAQHEWKVETGMDGSSARFHQSPPSGLFSRDSLSRNHE
jgi:hypothetical protein